MMGWGGEEEEAWSQGAAGGDSIILALDGLAPLLHKTKQKKKKTLVGGRGEERELEFHAHLCSLAHCPPFFLVHHCAKKCQVTSLTCLSTGHSLFHTTLTAQFRERKGYSQL